jgi:hypothetical protein
MKDDEKEEASTNVTVAFDDSSLAVMNAGLQSSTISVQMTEMRSQTMEISYDFEPKLPGDSTPKKHFSPDIVGNASMTIDEFSLKTNIETDDKIAFVIDEDVSLVSSTATEVPIKISSETDVTASEIIIKTDESFIDHSNHLPYSVADHNAAESLDTVTSSTIGTESMHIDDSTYALTLVAEYTSGEVIVASSQPDSDFKAQESETLDKIDVTEGDVVLTTNNFKSVEVMEIEPSNSQIAVENVEVEYFASENVEFRYNFRD